MSEKKKAIGYVIELNPENRSRRYAYSDDLKDAVVFPTREKARGNKRRHNGLRFEIIYKVALDCDGKPVSIIKRMR